MTDESSATSAPASSEAASTDAPASAGPGSASPDASGTGSPEPSASPEANASPTDLGDTPLDDGGAAPADAPADASAPGQPDGDALSKTAADPAGTPAPEASYAEWYSALPPHEQARIDGVPEENIKEGHYYFDAADGHGKFKDKAAFIKSRGLNDAYASGFKEKEAQYVTRAETAETRAETAEAELAKTQAFMKAVHGVTPSAEDMGAAFVEGFIQDERFKGVTLDDLVDETERREFIAEYTRATDRRDAYFQKAAEDAETERTSAAEAQAKAEADQAAFIERGDSYVAENLAEDAIGADTNDLRAARQALLSAPVGDGMEHTVLDGYRAVSQIAPQIAELARIGLRVQMHTKAGQPLPYAEATARPDQQQTTKEQPASRQAPPNAPAAKALETVIETSPSLPVPPGASAPRDLSPMQRIAQGRHARPRQ